MQDILFNKTPADLFADIEAMKSRNFLGKIMRRIAFMVTACACTVNGPMQAGFGCLVLQNPFCQRAATNIAEAYHQDLHAAKINAHGFAKNSLGCCGIIRLQASYLEQSALGNFLSS